MSHKCIQETHHLPKGFDSLTLVYIPSECIQVNSGRLEDPSEQIWEMHRGQKEGDVPLRVWRAVCMALNGT